jgi:hypothetical protein
LQAQALSTVSRSGAVGGLTRGGRGPIAKGLTTDYYGYSYEFTSPLHETYTVTAVDAQGHESAASPPVSNPIWDSSAC